MMTAIKAIESITAGKKIFICGEGLEPSQFEFNDGKIYTSNLQLGGRFLRDDMDLMDLYAHFSNCLNDGLSLTVC